MLKGTSAATPRRDEGHSIRVEERTFARVVCRSPSGPVPHEHSCTGCTGWKFLNPCPLTVTGVAPTSTPPRGLIELMIGCS